MDEFRRQLREVGERLLEWVSDATRQVSSATRRLRESRPPRADSGGRGAGDSGAPALRRPAADQFDDESAVIVATADDDVASVVGRIDIADAPEVILVVRRDVRALRRPTAWPHIAAHVRRRGIELAVVSPRSDVRAHARANGLRSSRTPGGLRPQRYYISALGQDLVIPPVPWGRIVRGSMIVVALGTIGVVGCYRVPSAQVTIIPASEEISASDEARPNAVVERSDLATQTILVDTVRRQVFTAVTTTTTGEVEVGDERALLEVSFANSSARVVQVPMGTRLSTDEGIAFLTDEDLDVPAAGLASVSATADLPGVDGNVGANALTNIDGEVPAGIILSGSTAGAGGTNRLTAAVSQDDVDRVRAIAGGVLDRIAIGTLEQAVAEDELGTLLPSSVSAAIFSEQPVQLLEEPSDIFVVEYVITASGLVVSDRQARDYGELLVLRDLPEGLALLPGSVTATVTPLPDRGRVSITATGRVAELSQIAVTANQITGMRPEAAQNLLQRELSLSEPPEIRISPDFLPWIWLPRRAQSIEVVIGSPELLVEGDAGDRAEAEVGTDAAGTPALPIVTSTPAPGG